MKSLRTRLVMGVTLLVAAASGGVSWFAWREADAARHGDLDQLLRDKASLLSKSLNRDNPREVYPSKDEMQRDQLGFFGQGFDTNLVFLWKSKELPETIPLDGATAFLARLHLSHQFETRVHPQLGPLRVVTYPVWEVRFGQPIVFAFVQILKPLTETRHASLALIARLTVASLIATALAGFATQLFVARWWSATARVTEAARELGNRAATSRRLPVPREDPETAAMAEAFNRMLDRIDQAMVNERRFIADASHELRTPLTILRGEIDVVLRRDRTAEAYRAILLSNREEIERLSRLTENLLLLAKADAGRAVVNRQPVDLVSLARDVLSRLEPIAQARQVTLRCEPDTPEIQVSGDPHALDCVLWNLVENATRYSPAEETVLVRVGSNSALGFQVIDRGRGIAPEHLPRLFDRFYRVDTARDRASGGAGLGLAIVKSLVEAHGGHVDVTSELGVGTTFTVRLGPSTIAKT